MAAETDISGAPLLVRLGTTFGGKEGEDIAKEYLSLQYPGARITRQVRRGFGDVKPSSYIVRGPGTPHRRFDFVLETERELLLWEVKSSKGTFILNPHQISDVDRVLFVVREKALVREVSAARVLRWMEKAGQAGRTIYGWEKMPTVHLDRLMKTLSEYYARGFTRFKIELLGKHSRFFIYRPGSVRIPARDVFSTSTPL